jgi:dihydrofolate reductase
MAKLVYAAIASLDGYVADRSGRWDWSVPDEEVHTAVNDLTRGVATFLLGRRMYDVLVAWETMDTRDQPAPIRDFAEIWKGADKVVYSRTLEAPSSARTRVEREFDPEAVRRMVDAGQGDLSVAGPELAAQAMRAGLVDEVHLFLSPVVVGGGTPAFPEDLTLELELLEERRFGNGVVYLRYATRD